MVSRVPADVREQVEQLIHGVAGDRDWSSLPSTEKAEAYADWARDPRIGGVLAHYMDARRVRVYIKDTLLKPYVREELKTRMPAVLACLGIARDTVIGEEMIKPHGVRFREGDLVCWGNSRDWKSLLMTAFERARAFPSGCTSVVLIETGQTAERAARETVRDAASKLRIDRIEWLK
jgi:hypothetical protein